MKNCNVYAMETEYILSKIYPCRVFIWNTLRCQRDKIQIHDDAWPHIVYTYRELMLKHIQVHQEKIKLFIIYLHIDKYFKIMLPLFCVICSQHLPTHRRRYDSVNVVSGMGVDVITNINV